MGQVCGWMTQCECTWDNVLGALEACNCYYCYMNSSFVFRVSHSFLAKPLNQGLQGTSSLEVLRYTMGKRKEFFPGMLREMLKVSRQEGGILMEGLKRRKVCEWDWDTGAKLGGKWKEQNFVKAFKMLNHTKVICPVNSHGYHQRLKRVQFYRADEGKPIPLMGLQACFILFFKCIYFWEREREKERDRGKSEREVDRGSKAGSELTAASPMQGWNSGAMRSWVEPKLDP